MHKGKVVAEKENFKIIDCARYVDSNIWTQYHKKRKSKSIMKDSITKRRFQNF